MGLSPASTFFRGSNSFVQCQLAQTKKTSAEAITGKIKKLMRAYRLYIKDDGSVLQTSSHFIIERINETFKRGFSRFPTNLHRFEDFARITRNDTNRKFGFKVKRSPIFFKMSVSMETFIK